MGQGESAAPGAGSACSGSRAVADPQRRRFGDAIDYWQVLYRIVSTMPRAIPTAWAPTVPQPPSS